MHREDYGTVYDQRVTKQLQVTVTVTSHWMLLGAFTLCGCGVMEGILNITEDRLSTSKTLVI